MKIKSFISKASVDDRLFSPRSLYLSDESVDKARVVADAQGFSSLSAFVQVLLDYAIEELATGDVSNAPAVSASSAENTQG